MKPQVGPEHSSNKINEFKFLGCFSSLLIDRELKKRVTQAVEILNRQEKALFFKFKRIMFYQSKTKNQLIKSSPKK